MNTLYYGDNLDVLPEIPNESVDLVYLDPPFNSQRAYNVFLPDPGGGGAKAQIQAFDDTWTWGPEAAAAYQRIIETSTPKVAVLIRALRELIHDNNLFAYLVMMAPRLLELHRVLKPTGSLYLHCDPTASHYLKVLLDAIFGVERFLNEIIWKRTSGHSDATSYGSTHDVILFVARAGAGKRTWHQQFAPYDSAYIEQYYRYVDSDGRRFMSDNLSAAGLAGGGYDYEWKGVRRVWRCPIETMKRLDGEGRVFYTKNGVPRRKRFLDESKGLPQQDLWSDIEAIRSWHEERLGYPTQKPRALLERIITASSNEGDVVLDPFCGCGTTIDAAQRLKREWIGIDITYIAIDLIQKRLLHVFGSDSETKVPRVSVDVRGIPRDIDGARALFARNAFDFERWAVSLVDGQPNQKQIGDRGVDGVVRFALDKKRDGKAIVSVKGGKNLTPNMIRDLGGTIASEQGEMGVLIVLETPTSGMVTAAKAAGVWRLPIGSRDFPKIQILTVADLLAGLRPKMPTPYLPYIRAKAKRMTQSALDLTARTLVVAEEDDDLE